VVAVNNEDATLLPGMTATVNFETAKAANVLRIQNAALRFRPSEMMLAAADLPQRRAGAAGADSSAGRRQFTAADSARFRQMMAQRRAQGGAGGAGGAGGFGGGAGGAGGGGSFGGAGGSGGAGGFGMMAAGANNVAVLWTLDANGKPAPVRVHTGLTDGQLTEISGPTVKAGMKIIAAVTNEKSNAASNPFQAQQQQGGPGRRVL